MIGNYLTDNLLSIGVNLLLVIPGVLLAMLVVAFVVVIGIFIAGSAIVVAGPVSFIGGLSVITKNVAAAICCFGYGLIGIGSGILLIYVMYQMCRVIANKLIQVFGRIVKKGEEKHE